MGKLRDLTGQRFGRLAVVELAGVQKRRSYWKCKCDCGNEITVYSYALISGNTRSCGCLRKEVTREKRRKHGFSKTKLYRVWQNVLKHNCCDEWKNSSVFIDWAMKHGYYKGSVIHKFDNNEKHSPYNTYFEPRFALCDVHGSSVPQNTIFNRLYRGWDLQDACSIPKIMRKKRTRYTSLIGQKVGRLTIIGDSGMRDKHGKRIMECACDCGKKCFVRLNSLTRGNTRSCGCLRSKNKQ